jgi:serine phosphatase RsbU (regulator of sigma subunit)
MEWDTSSWGEVMIAFAQAMFETSRRATRADGEMSAVRSLAGMGNDAAKKLQSLTEELDRLRSEQAKLQQAVFEAAQIQRRLCAPRELSWGEFEMAGEIFPVRHLSGDFFKVIELGPVLGFALGDIAGKGFTAGIWQAHLMSLVQQSARKHASPADALAEVNQELCQAADEPPLTALFFARIEPRTNELTYCNAGLPAPLLLRSNEVVRRLDRGGPMLGALKTADFETGRVTLDPGDMLVAYSDGVTECRNAAEEEFEMERLTAAATAVSDANATKALFSLLGTVLDFAGSCSPGDDMTLMVVRRRPQQERTEALPRKKFVSSSKAAEPVVTPKGSRSRGRNSK